MRMFRFSSWISESRGDKAIDGDVDHKMANATRPVVEIPFNAEVAKRKRSESEDTSRVKTEDIQEPKRRKYTGYGSLDSEEHEEGLFESEIDLPLSPTRILDTIESHFSLEMLLKHDELRLIQHEIAKAQAGLEQLRRSHLIPYPNVRDTPESMIDVSNGTGPALRQSNKVPLWAPPYGVADGPYAKHYSKWLIPDFSFDGARDDWPSLDGSRGGKTTLEGRSTRNSIGEGSSSATKSRTQRGSTGQKLQALSSGYPQAKEKAGPCVLKLSDGQMVKLVCLDCHRDNFSSTQGFINHCRIAHRREFKSHEEAAVASGQPIELDDMGGIVGEERTQPGDGLVHPLIRSAPVDKAAYIALRSRIDASLALFKQGKLPGVTSIPTSATSTPIAPSFNANFVPSPETPHLSNFMRSRGFGGNLTDMIGEAKTPLDLEDLSSEESDDGESQPLQSIGGLDGNDSPRPIMRMPSRAAMSPAPFGRPGSSKGTKSSFSPRTSYATPVMSSAGPGNYIKPSPLLVNHHRDDFDNQHDGDGDLDMGTSSFVDLSPNTVASNNAPSLVSDDGEYDDGDDAESVSSDEADEGSDVAEIEFIDGEVEKVAPRAVLRNRSGSGGDGMRLRKEDKHVTFVSPVKETKAKERRAQK